jgi:hypothetical protein
MQMKSNLRIAALFVASLLAAPSVLRAQVVINEFHYDDTGTDDVEFIELFNAGSTAVSIGGWQITSQDQVGPNTTINITAGASIPAGGYYVIAPTALSTALPGVVNQITALAMENDAETLELRDGTTALIDALLQESNKGPTAASNAGHGTLPTAVVGQVGRGIWGNFQTNNSAGEGTPPLGSLGRFINGLDSDNNGRDIGLRRATPGAANSSGIFSTYSVPTSTHSLAADAVAPGYGSSFVQTRVIDPTITSQYNPNVITAPPSGPRALTLLDRTGGGNATATDLAFQDGGGFDIFAYINTSDITLGAGNYETTAYALGGVDAVFNTPDPSGAVLGTLTGPSAAGLTGVAWIIQRNSTDAKLYLVDAKDGGNSSTTPTGTQYWNVLQTIDINALASDWYRLTLSVDATGSISATFNGTTYTGTTVAGLDGAFSVGYRENITGLPISTDVNAAQFRPATWAPIPEPTTLGLLAGAGMLALRRKTK